jgi:hypothetical protein
MSFEIKDGKEEIPPEEDIYGVDDIVEEEEFNSLLGMKSFSQEARMRRRRNIIIVVAALILLSFALAFGQSIISIFGR